MNALNVLCVQLTRDLFTEIWRYNDFQNGGRPPSWNCFTTIRHHQKFNGSDCRQAIRYLVYRLPTIGAILLYWITIKVVQQLTCLTYRSYYWLGLFDRSDVEHAPGQQTVHIMCTTKPKSVSGSILKPVCQIDYDFRNQRLSKQVSSLPCHFLF